MFTISDPCFYKFIALSDLYCIDASFPRLAICRKNCFFNYSVACCHHNIVLVIKLFNANKGLYFFTWVTTNKINNGPSPSSSATLWNIIDLEPITLPLVCEKQHIVMCVCYKQMLYKVFFLAHSPLNSATTAPLCSVGVQSCALYVSLVGNSKHNFFFSYHVFH